MGSLLGLWAIGLAVLGALFGASEFLHRKRRGRK